MDVALVTVGEELLSGTTENTNATWLARQLTDSGATVRRLLTVPDDRAVIAEWVGRFAEAFDAVIVTGGLGDTPDDVTLEAVADAFDRELTVDTDVKAAVEKKARRFREENTDLADAHDFDLDLSETAATPEASRPLVTAESFNPGCVVESVYVFPGFPEELRAMFALVAEEFGGDAVSETIATATPEGALTRALAAVREQFDVTVGSYPGRDGDPGRITVTGTDSGEVSAAVDWLADHDDVVPVNDGP
jgi:molybdenum cofactor synthesis domain-containing protein